MEEECLRVLALYQPVAIDLRLIVSVLKINNDLERVGDLAVNVAHKALAVVNELSVAVPDGLPDMAAKTQVDAPRQHRCAGEPRRETGGRRVRATTK